MCEVVCVRLVFTKSREGQGNIAQESNRRLRAEEGGGERGSSGQ